MNDLVQRLRDNAELNRFSAGLGPDATPPELLEQAADEIERKNRTPLMSPRAETAYICGIATYAIINNLFLSRFIQVGLWFLLAALVVIADRTER